MKLSMNGLVINVSKYLSANIGCLKIDLNAYGKPRKMLAYRLRQQLKFARNCLYQKIRNIEFLKENCFEVVIE